MIMPMAQSDLTAEVQELIAEIIQAHRVQDADWITQVIVSKHSAIQGDDADFYLLCAYKHVRETVRAVLHSYKDRVLGINRTVKWTPKLGQNLAVA
jgi:hypothetical protein